MASARILSCLLGIGAVSSSLLPNVPSARFGNAPAPFELKVDPDFINNVHDRVRLARAPVAIEGIVPDDSDGPPVSEYKAIQDFWVQSYDWEATQVSINRRLKQFTTTVHTSDSNSTFAEVPLHFVHHTSPRSDAIPLLFIHGWPGSFLEVSHMIDRLTHPPNSSLPAFHVVAPSIPGWGFSPAPKHAGFGGREAARAFNALMLQLGYPKYVINGGDFGGIILRFQTAAYPNNVVSALCNFWVVPPNSTDLVRYATRQTTPDETAYLVSLESFENYASGYRVEQEATPLTIAYALTDSPLGYAMWIYALMRESVDPADFRWTPQEIITWSLMHTIQGPYGGLRFYKEMLREGGFAGEAGLGFGGLPFVTRPVAINEFPYDFWYRMPLDWAQREGNVKRRFVHDRGGHFAAYEVPQLMAGDLWTWFGDEEVSGTKVFRNST